MAKSGFRVFPEVLKSTLKGTLKKQKGTQSPESLSAYGGEYRSRTDDLPESFRGALVLIAD